MDEETVFYIIALIALILLGSFLSSLPPHTDPGVELIEPGVARVHDGEILVLWFPAGKGSAKYTFLFQDDRVVVKGTFITHYDMEILEGCKTFKFGLIRKVEACRDGDDVIFYWKESFFGIRIDR